jgi:hypothetical protein
LLFFFLSPSSPSSPSSSSSSLITASFNLSAAPSTSEWKRVAMMVLRRHPYKCPQRITSVTETSGDCITLGGLLLALFPGGERHVRLTNRQRA